MNGSVAWSEHQHVQLSGYQTKGLIAALRVVLPGVLSNQRRAPVKVLGQVEGKAKAPAE